VQNKQNVDFFSVESSRTGDLIELQAAALEATANAVMITNKAGMVIWVNSAFEQLTGYTHAEIVGQSTRVLKSGQNSQALYEEMWRTILGGRIWRGELTNRRKDGSLYDEEMTITPVQDRKGEITHYIAIKLDISERRQAEANLLSLTERLSLATGVAKVGVWEWDLASNALTWDATMFEIYGFPFVVPMPYEKWSAAVYPEDLPAVEDTLREAIDEKGRGSADFRIILADGTVRNVSTVGTVVLDEHANVSRVIGTAQDITERKQGEEALRQAKEKYRAIFEDAVVAIFQSTPGGRYTTVNPAMAHMLGYDSPQELIASITDISLQVYVDSQSREELKRLLREHGTVRNFECQIYRKDGSKMWISANVRAVSKAGVLVGYEGLNEDITARKVAEEQAQFLAYYDALTGLPNRTLLRDRLTNALAGALRRGDKVAVLFLDLDRFKVVNDSLGHSCGDLLLQDVAERLKKWARQQDTVARLGGDEFLIVLNGLKDVADAAVAADRLMDAMAAEFTLQGHSFSISCSLGISIFPEHGTDVETLMKNADAAMYCAKDNGRANFRFFTEEMNAQVVERLMLESSLRQALDKKELFLMYQPQMDIATGRITGLEALLRWQHPELGLVPPDRFIRIAENSGLIIPIGEWVLRTACSQSRKWQDEGLPAVPVAVNVSAVQFRQEYFGELIRRVLHETGLAPKYLELEITESLLLSNADVMFSVFQELKAMGLRLAIDDFGTGYSSLSYLKKFPVSKLKIDRSFVRDVAVNTDDAAITNAIISMAKSLNLKVIAEGVENEAQLSFLRAHQCDEIQGYYFSKPLPVADVAEKFRGNAQHAGFLSAELQPRLT
jgi:diguanylate cyclase (GGDEF)-like protein/PAS domain S-box-containing protein